MNRSAVFSVQWLIFIIAFYPCLNIVGRESCRFPFARLHARQLWRGPHALYEDGQSCVRCRQRKRKARRKHYALYPARGLSPHFRHRHRHSSLFRFAHRAHCCNDQRCIQSGMGEEPQRWFVLHFRLALGGMLHRFLDDRRIIHTCDPSSPICSRHRRGVFLYTAIKIKKILFQ